MTMISLIFKILGITAFVIDNFYLWRCAKYTLIDDKYNIKRTGKICWVLGAVGLTSIVISELL